MNTIAKFFQPYLAALAGAAFNLQQTLEGLKVRGSNFLSYDSSGDVVGSYWSATEAVALPFLALLVFICILTGLFLAAIRILAGWRGAGVGFAALAFPGLLSLAGLWPTVPWLPRAYNVGSGSLGSPWGMFALLAVALSTGWTVVVLATKVLNLDDRFRHGYDQFWYAMAIATGLAFVADIDATQTRDQLRESAATSQAASAYLLEQVRRLEVNCETGQFKLLLACQWAKSSQWSLARYAYYGDKLFWQLGPEDTNTFYDEGPSKTRLATAQALRQELHQYNLIKCPVANLGGGVRQSSPVSRNCQATPSSFCTAYPDIPLQGLDRRDGPLLTVAIGNECVLPTLVSLKAEQSRLASEVAANMTVRHLRWLFFLFTALVAGGKVANASVRMSLAIRQQAQARMIACAPNTPLATPDQRAPVIHGRIATMPKRPIGQRTMKIGVLARRHARIRSKPLK